MKKKKTVSSEDILSLQELADSLLRSLQDKGLQPAQIATVLQQALEKQEKEEQVPLSIFSSPLTVLESLVRYLKDERKKSLHEISLLLGRDERNLWHSFTNAKRKLPEGFSMFSELLVPVRIFANTAWSPQEALVVYLKEQEGRSLRKIAGLLARDERTIGTVYRRARKKYARQD